jgi:hypothetical protein
MCPGRVTLLGRQGGDEGTGRVKEIMSGFRGKPSSAKLVGQYFLELVF